MNKTLKNNISHSIKIFEFISQEKDSGMRLDVFLFAKIKERKNINIFSRNRIKALIEENYVCINGKVVSNPSKTIKPNSQYKVLVPKPKPAYPKAEKIDLSIVFEDEDLIVIDKPAGMVVHPAFGNHTGTLVNALLFHCRNSLSGIGGFTRPGIVHRIDKDTSGLLVSAKNDLTHTYLSNQFREHSIVRKYQALVWGTPPMNKGIINKSICRHPKLRKKMAVNTNGKHAITYWKIIKKFNNIASLLQCNLETGRTHQIRVHMSHIGHSLIGDQVYGNSKYKRKFNTGINKSLYPYLTSFPRQFLHAQSLGFIHPRGNKQMIFESPLPKDMKKLVLDLNNNIEI